MAEFSRGDNKQRKLLANVLEYEDDFILRNPQQPLPFASQKGVHVCPTLFETDQEQEAEGAHIFSNIDHMHYTTTPNQTNNIHLTKYHLPSCPLARVENIHGNTFNKARRAKKYIINNSEMTEQELRNVLKEIRVITDKIRDEVIDSC